MFLYNRVNRRELKGKADQEAFRRITVSFYRYVHIDNPAALRNTLYEQWHKLKVLGRIYIAAEGINAQCSVPEHNLDDFLLQLYSIAVFEGVQVKKAIEEKGSSFYRLTIKVKQKIVADGIRDETFDPADTGTRLDPLAFHRMADQAVVVDMRNRYESELGRFTNAICPDVKTFREALPKVVQLLEGKNNQNILLYCTGGIRCEKASAWLKHKGFENVYQLDGGIIEYARQIKQTGLDSKFIGKNFVFDARMAERITDDVLGSCHRCGSSCNRQANCANQPCHTLIIQCESCSNELNGCCGEKCLDEYKTSKNRILQ